MDPLTYSDSLDESSQPSISNWVISGQYHKIGMVKSSQNGMPFLAEFSKCALLPMIQVAIQNNRLVATVDTGASKSLLSSSIACLLWGENYMDNIDTSNTYYLTDVNGKYLTVQGSIKMQFSINEHLFEHTFLIFQSSSREILLGIDFLKQKSIAVYPNMGLTFEHQNIFRLGEEFDPLFPMILDNDLCLNSYQQAVVTVTIDIDKNDPRCSLLLDSFVIAHSEHLQGEVSFADLSVYFQYVKVDSMYQTQILYVNHSDDYIYLPARSVIGHIEFLKQVATVKEIEKDSLGNALYNGLQIVDGQTIHPSESRICYDPPLEDKFDEKDINCYSSASSDLQWLKELHLRYKDIFSKDDWDPGKACSTISFGVRTNATVCKQKFNRINPAIRQEALEIIDMLLARDLISISKSNWSSRVLFVPKQAEEYQTKDNQNAIPGKKNVQKRRKVRMVIDMRHVNLRLKDLNTAWVTPNLNDILNQLYDASYCSSIDICSGFWTFKLSENCRKFTAFQFEDITYHCNRLPQGLKISSRIMQCQMKRFILRNNLRGVLVYIDNCIIYSNSHEEYQNRLEAFFKACQLEGFHIKMRKSHHFIVDTFLIFGFEINLKNHFITPEKDKITKIMSLPAPTTKKKVKQFIGAVSFFNNLIPHLQHSLAALHCLAAPKTKFVWSPACEQSFTLVKTLLEKIPLIYLIRPDRKIEFTCDGAKGQYVAYTLFQYHNDMKTMVPVRFNSHKLSKSEQNLSQYEVESLALIFCLLKEEQLLAFGNAQLITDARSLCFISRFANSTSKLSRWNIIIRSYGLTIKFLPNSDAKIQVADLLTRGVQKNVQQHKIDLEKFMQLDFSHLPVMEVTDVLDLIEKLYQCFSKFALPKDVVNRIRSILPSHSMQIYEDPNTLSSLVRGPACLVAQIEDDHLKYSEKALTVPSSGSLSIPTIEWEQPVQSPLTMSEIVANYLGGISITQLVTLQESDTWVQNIRHDIQQGKIRQKFFIYQNILMKHSQLKNGNFVRQIVLPLKVSTVMLKLLHEQSYYKHTGVPRMQRIVEMYFSIKNFQQLASQIVKNCEFCSLNLIYPNKKLTPALKLMVNKPRQFLYMDICVTRSASNPDGFLTIVDAFTHFVLYVPINSDCVAQVVVDKIMAHWVKHFGFPLAISTDGAANFSNKLMGEVANIMHTKLFRISPFNSKSNFSERYNLFALQTLRMFHQSYEIKDTNYDLILTMTGLLINAFPRSNGHTPFFLQFGSHPRTNQFISFQSLTTMKTIPSYVQELSKCQNLCYFLQEQMLKTNKQHTKEMQNLKTYKIGDFVLLRIKKDSKPRNLHKLRPQYYKDIFRIIKRYETNALLCPYNRKFMKNRLHKEGKVTKAMCTLQKLTRLKPVLNPLRLLQLSISEKLLLGFRKALAMPECQITAIEIVPNITLKGQPNEIIKDHNLSVCVISDHEEARLKIQNPGLCSSIQDIMKIKLQTYTENSDFFMQNITNSYENSNSDSMSNPIDRLIPKKKPLLKSLSNCSINASSHHLEIPLIEAVSSCDDQDLSNMIPIDNSSSNSYRSVASLEGGMRGTLTPPPVVEKSPSPPQSVRPKLSGKKSRTKSTITQVRLPSGKSLLFSSNPIPDDVMLDKPKK